MKKPVEKRIVQMEVTEDWIKGYGSRKEMKKRYKPYVVVFGIALVGVIIVAILDKYTNKKYDVVFYVCMAGMLSAYFHYWYKTIKEGNKFWNKIKDNDQPIKL